MTILWLCCQIGMYELSGETSLSRSCIHGRYIQFHIRFCVFFLSKVDSINLLHVQYLFTDTWAYQCTDTWPDTWALSGHVILEALIVLLVQRPITLILMMTNSNSYSTNNLVVFKFHKLIKILVGI